MSEKDTRIMKITWEPTHRTLEERDRHINTVRDWAETTALGRENAGQPADWLGWFVSALVEHLPAEEQEAIGRQIARTREQPGR